MTVTHDAVWLGSGIQPSRMFCLVSVTLMLYDYLCTLNQEINLIWKRRLGTPTTVLFLLNRYLPYLYVFSAIKYYWSIAHSQEECTRKDAEDIIPIAMNLFMSELILALRTWAIWNKSKFVLWTLLIMWSAKVPLVLLMLYHVFHDAHYINISPTEIFCISPVLGSWSWETLCFVIILVVETIIAALTLVKGVQAPQSSSRWFFKILYMGIIYYFYNLLMTVANLIATIYLRNMGFKAFVVLQGVLQSILCSRVIFLVRSPSELGMTVSDEGISTVLLTTWRAKITGSRRDTERSEIDDG